MQNKEKKKIEQVNCKKMKKIDKFKKSFFSYGKRMKKNKKEVEFIEGNSSIAILISYENSFGEKDGEAEGYLYGIVRLLASEIGCHIIIRQSAGESCEQDMLNKIEEYIIQKEVKVCLNLYIVETPEESIVFWKRETCQEDENYNFLKNAIRYSFEYKYKDKNLTNVLSETDNQYDDIISKIAKGTPIIHICLGINRNYLNPINKNQFIFFNNTFFETIFMLSNIDWKAEKIRVYKLWQSKKHKPQDKVELFCSESDKRETDFSEGSLLDICTYGFGLEKVRLHIFNEEDNTEEIIPRNLIKEEYIFLTNRLIEILFGREWIENGENSPGLMGAPIIVCSNFKEQYSIGLPKANQIDGVFFSSALYESKQLESNLFDYIIFNCYTDSRLHVEFEKMDYADHGRVKNAEGKPMKKVMIPRYYKRLLGYLDEPLQMIREEEYDNIIKALKNEEEREAFNTYYEKIPSEVFYKAKRIQEDSGNEGIKDIVIKVQKRLKLYQKVEILKIPKEVKAKEKLIEKIKHKWDKFKLEILKRAIGKSEYLLKAEWTSETDDRNNIARLSPNMMSLLGILENDKILVKFGKNEEILRVLAKESLTDYQIGIPAPARKRLRMNSINDIVIVHRDMRHIFWRHSEEQTIAILGTVLAVFQVVTHIWLGALACLIIVPSIMYFVLNEERIKVK